MAISDAVIFTGQDAIFICEVRKIDNDELLVLHPSATVKMALVDPKTGTTVSPVKTISSSAVGNNWNAGKYALPLEEEDTEGIEPGVYSIEFKAIQGQTTIRGRTTYIVEIVKSAIS